MAHRNTDAVGGSLHRKIGAYGALAPSTIWASCAPRTIAQPVNIMCTCAHNYTQVHVYYECICKYMETWHPPCIACSMSSAHIYVTRAFFSSKSYDTKWPKFRACGNWAIMRKKLYCCFQKNIWCWRYIKSRETQILFLGKRHLQKAAFSAQLFLLFVKSTYLKMCPCSKIEFHRCRGRLSFPVLYSQTLANYTRV